MRPIALLTALLLLASCSSDGGGVGNAAAPDAATSGDSTPDALATADTATSTDGATDTAAPDTAGDVGAGDTDAGAPLVHVASADGCDPLAPAYCPLPWPSDRYLKEVGDGSTTGFRLAYVAEAVPENEGKAPFDLAPYNRLDGYSPSSQLLVMFQAVPDLSDAAGSETIDRSMESDSPSLLIDLDSGALLPHWVELDARAQAEDGKILYLRPTQRLEVNHRYGVAYRELRGPDGSLIQASPAFAALRDGTPTDDPILESRRGSYEALFQKLEAAGVPREDLQVAWWWKTASFGAIHDDLLAMRADALERLGADGLGCTIDKVEENYKGVSFRKVLGTIRVPSYLDSPDPGAAMVRDAAGRPIWVADYDVPFVAIIPKSLAEVPEAGPLLIFGHGLFGEADGTVSSRPILELAEAGSTILAAMDWAGMSTKDLPFLAKALTNISLFIRVGERVQQGMINKIAMTRTLLGVCRTRPELSAPDGTPLIDPERRFFLGASQGSILGGTFLTLSPDIRRGILLVGGQNFSFMIERSIHYKTFEPLLKPSYPRRVDRAFLMALSQHIWDMGESSSWLRWAGAPPTGDPPRELLYIVAKNDAQVPNLSSDLAVRSAGIPVLEGSVYVPWGAKVVKPPYKGSAFIAMDYGDRIPPAGNLSPQKDDGGHTNVPMSAESVLMIQHFLGTGEAFVPCDGPCVIAK